MKKLSKEEIEQLYEEQTKLFNNLATVSPLKQMHILTIEIPKFYDKIFSMGYETGFNDGKNEKINRIIKSN